VQSQSEQRTGLLYGIGAYGMWGLVPLFWPLLKPAGAMEMLAHIAKLHAHPLSVDMLADWLAGSMV